MAEPRQLLDCPDRSNLGRRLTLAPGGDFEALLDVRGDDAAARAVTVHLDVRPTTTAPGGVFGPDAVLTRTDEVRARARLEAGVGGHVARIELDVAAGVRVGVSVSSLRVSAVNDGGAPIDVGAFVGYGTSSGSPSLTVFGAPLSFMAEWELDVPAFARSVEILRPPDSELRVDVALGRAGGVVGRWLYGQRVLPDQRMAPLPLANGCRRLRVTSLAPGRRLNPVALFHLAL